jgi:hypothetical protein
VILRGAYAVRAGVRDGDGHWATGAGAVAGALNLLHIHTPVHSVRY